MTETFIHREILELRRRGINIKIYSIRKPDPSKISNETNALIDDTYYILPVKLKYLLRCHIYFILNKPIVYFKTFWKMISGSHNKIKDRVRSFLHFGEGVVLADRIINDKITHIHAHYASQSASVARVVHLMTNVPYSFTAHAHDIWHDRLLIKQKLEEAVFIVTCSKFGKEWLLKDNNNIYANKIHVVYHGLDIRKFLFHNNYNKREKNMILSIGSLGPTKGFPDLIKACSILKLQGYDLRCLIIGEGEEKNLLESIISEEKLENTVKLVGAVLPENLSEFYNKSYIFVLPCVTATDGRQDGIPNVLMESMATGLPVITTDNTAQNELIENLTHGLLINPRKPNEIVDAIKKLWENKDLWESIQLNARKRMEDKFDCYQTIEPLIELFNKHANI